MYKGILKKIILIGRNKVFGSEKMNENILKWVWLTTLKGMTPEKISSLLNKFNDIDEIYNACKDEYKDIDLIRKKDIEVLCDKDTQTAKNIIYNTQRIGAYILTVDSDGYPEKLKSLPYPPYVLYVRGKFKLNDEMPAVGVVGTRHTSEYGDEITNKFGYELAGEGFLVVSGLAIGVDALAAQSAIRAGGTTVAVLGCGIDVDYPKQNRILRKYIEEFGAVVTEYPPGTSPLPANFPQRNRIIAGLSDCILVTQAPERSGALITARYAYDIGREIFCVPASVYDYKSAGGNELIRFGASSATKPQNITQLYEHRLKNFKPLSQRRELFNKKPKNKGVSGFVEKVKETILKEKPSITDNRYKNLEENEKIIMELIIENEKITVDEIIRKTEMAPAKIGATLSMMEMTGVIRKLPGNFYVATE